MLDIVAEELSAVEPFLEEGLILEVLQPLKAGKEASAYLCRAGSELGARFAVAKVYHDIRHRNFAQSGTYEEGRLILNGQVRRAVASRTEFGRGAQVAMWVDHEFETLSALHYAGCDVPEPFVATERAILMEYVGDSDGPAPQLQHVQLERSGAAALLERLLADLGTYLGQSIVHADLSAFNILHRPGRLTVIDFPQAVDPRFNSQARRLLGRDLANVAKYFGRCGLGFDADAEANRLWRAWKLGEL